MHMANMPTECISTPKTAQEEQLPDKPYLVAPSPPVGYQHWREDYVSHRKQTYNHYCFTVSLVWL